MARFFRSVTGAICGHMETGLTHKVGDVEALSQHITMLHEDRALLERLRAASLKIAPKITWTAAGRILLEAYRETIKARSTATPAGDSPAALALPMIYS